MGTSINISDQEEILSNILDLKTTSGTHEKDVVHEADREVGSRYLPGYIPAPEDLHLCDVYRD